MKYIKYLRFALLSFFVFRNPIDFLLVQVGKRKGAILTTWSRLTIPVWGVDDSSSLSVIFLKKEYGDMPKGVVFDVGANKAYFSLFAAEQGAQVYAFEPDQKTFKEAQEVVSKNIFYSEKIKLFNIGLGDKTGPRSFFHDPNSSIASSFVQKLSDKAEEVVIECSTLESFLSKEKVDRIDLFKIDAEGAEYEIFYSMNDDVLQKIVEIRMEYHNVANKVGYSIEKLSSYLQSKGYKNTKLEPAGEGCGIAWFVRNTD